MTRKTLKLLSRAEARMAVKQGKPVQGFAYQKRPALRWSTTFDGCDLSHGNFEEVFQSCHAFVLWPEKEGKR